jgi:hypothetical protein
VWRTDGEIVGSMPLLKFIVAKKFAHSDGGHPVERSPTPARFTLWSTAKPFQRLEAICD